MFTVFLLVSSNLYVIYLRTLSFTYYPSSLWSNIREIWIIINEVHLCIFSSFAQGSSLLGIPTSHIFIVNLQRWFTELGGSQFKWFD